MCLINPFCLRLMYPTSHSLGNAAALLTKADTR